MAPKAKKAIFLKQSLVYGVFSLLSGRLPTLCLHWANLTYDCSGDVGAKLQLAAPQKEPSQGPDSTAGNSDSTAGISDSTAGISPVKKSPSGTFCQTSYAECLPKLFSPSGRMESPSGRTESTAGILRKILR